MRAHARVYTTTSMVVKSCHIKRAKKNPRTLAYASYGPQGDWKPDDFRNTVVANSWRVC
nr:MAG TPA: hypothetical protein [Caudoviricetes sp.]